MPPRKKSSALTIVQEQIGSLRPATYNPRKWNEAQLATLMESLSRFGFVDPVIVNGASSRNNVVIGGHMRLEAAKRLGMKTVPVVHVHIPRIERNIE
mgnify:CR=1 FL=1